MPFHHPLGDGPAQSAEGDPLLFFGERLDRRRRLRLLSRFGGFSLGKPAHILRGHARGDPFPPLG